VSRVAVRSGFRTSGPSIPASLRTSIRRRLLRWYDGHRRALPWRRRQSDPYAQWVAEIMLQQTRVDTVLPYYARFLKRFPAPRRLAAASHDAVLKQWEGLGYYRRALNLHRAAKVVRDRYDGVMPESARELRMLPGIGEYTAAAIASIAYGERVAAVDGNVARVLARLFGVTHDVLSSRGRRQFAGLAQQLIPRHRPGDFNQAWMDLGSAVCTPQGPDCPNCPLFRVCIHANTGTKRVLPVRGARKASDVPRVDLVTAVFVHDGRLLACRRPVGGLWSGLWEFPSDSLNGAGDAAATVRSLARRERLRMNGRPRFVATVGRRLTHRAISFHVVVCDVEPRANPTGDDSRRWVTVVGLKRLSLSAAHHSVLRAAMESLEARMAGT
jgi:A/G-specific adenine glycosylase